jgi:hypothetical protein
MADGSVSAGPSGGITGSLTTGYIPRATGTTTLGNSIIQDDGRFITVTSTDNTANRTTLNDILTITQLSPNAPYAGFGTGILFRGTTYNGGGSGIPGTRTWGRIGSQLTDLSGQTTGENMIFQVATADNSDTLTTALTLAYNGAATFSSSVTAASYGRASAGTGYLNGKYSGVETTATTGPIYCLGDAYVPTSTTLGTMYGIGYSYNNFTGAYGPVDWGMYVAANGTSGIFLSGSGNGYFNGKVLIGTTTDAGYKLDVNGTGRFSGAVTTASPLTIQAGAPYIQWLNVAATRLGYIQHDATNLVYNADTGTHVFNQATTIANTSGDTLTLSKSSGPSIKFSKTTATAQDWALAGEGSAFKLYDYTASTTPFLVTTAGNVGIGTASPTNAGGYATLTVGGGGSIKGQVTWNSGAVAIGYAYNDASNMTIGSNADLIFATTISGTERVRLTSDGSLGINSSNPVNTAWGSGTTTKQLSIIGSSYAVINLQGATRNYSMGVGDGYFYMCYDNSQSRHNLTVAPSGNVIINGTSDAGYKLDVSGTARIQGAATFSSTVSISSTLTLSNTLIYNGTYDSSSPLDLIRSTYAGGANCGIKITAYNPLNGVDSDLGFSVMNSGASYVQPLYLQGRTSRVGIGTTSPATKLEIYDTDGSGARTTPYNVATITADNSSNPYDGFGAGLLFRNRIYSGGPSPGGIQNGARIRTSIRTNSSVNYGTDLAFDVTTTGNGSLTEIFRLSYGSGALAGLGTSNPAGQLSGTKGLSIVDGTNAALGLSNGTNHWLNYLSGTTYRIWNNTSSEVMTLTLGGNVLIGTASDSGYKLDVNGTGRFTSSVTATSYARSSAGTGYLNGKYSGVENTNTTGPIYCLGDSYVPTATSTATMYGIGYSYNSFTGAYGPANDWGMYVVGGGTVGVYLSAGGNGYFRGSVTATSFFESSDKTIKTLIEDNYEAKGIENVTAKLYIKDGKEELGYFAQDVQNILPSAVSVGDSNLLSLSYREVHTAKIARLEKRVSELEQLLNLN